MKYLDATLPVPAENLALDEALLDHIESGGEATLRLWEPPTHFVVLGFANRVATEVNKQLCERMGIPVLRRCSGGGTVLQGPGCLNYSLILPFDHAPELQTVTGANRFIMQRHSQSLTKLLGREVEWNGCTDLALAGRKFSGNAQRRKRHSLLFHGTFLLNFDLPLIAHLLPMPSSQPDYRAGRAHSDFLTNLDVAADTVKAALCKSWNAVETPSLDLREQVAALVGERYGRAEWNLRS